MPLDLTDFEYDQDLETAGIWREIGQGAAVRVARALNKNYIAARDRVREQRSLELAYETLTQDEKDEMNVRLEAETIFLDFRGINCAGVALKNTFETRLQILRNSDMRSIIRQISYERAFFKAKKEAAEIKKTGEPLSGS